MSVAVTYPSFWLSPNATTGYLFEQWVVKQFDSEQFKLREWRSDKSAAKKFADSGKNPDLVFETMINNTPAYFAIECKFRNTHKSVMSLGKEYQIKNYKKFEGKYNMQVFVVLGVEGYPYKPLDTYLIPLELINTNLISDSSLGKYVSNNLSSTLLENLITNYR